MKLLLGIALLIGVLVGRSSFAATFYVATTGDDSNSCTEAQNPSTPKRNIIGARGNDQTSAALQLGSRGQQSSLWQYRAGQLSRWDYEQFRRD